MPKNGSVAEPGFVAMAPGSGVIMIAARFRLPPRIDDRAALLARRHGGTTSQASGLIGSPTVPSSFSDLRLVLFDKFARPAPMSARIAVGAV